MHQCGAPLSRFGTPPPRQIGFTSMRILDVRRRTTADRLVVTARCKTRRIGLDDLTFSVPARLAHLVLADASPFAAGLLLPAMRIGEDLVVHGAMSAELHKGMTDIVQMAQSWGIGLRPISIEADELLPDTGNPAATGSFFSGGVDSFYTYLNHQGRSDGRVTHMILVNGYDIDPRNPGLWDVTRRHIDQIAGAEQVTLVDVETNLRSLTDPLLPWPYAIGGGLAAVALLMRAGMRQIYIPDSYDSAHEVAWFNFDADRLWGTETLSICHDGFEASRLTKVERIARHPLALKHLRVCYKNQQNAYNCGKCEKCLRTMVSLYVAGALDKAETFPDDIDAAQIATMMIDRDVDALFHQENLAALRDRDLAPGLQAALEAALARAMDGSSATPLFRSLIMRADRLDYAYARGMTRRLKARIRGRDF